MKDRKPKKYNRWFLVEGEWKKQDHVMALSRRYASETFTSDKGPFYPHGGNWKIRAAA